MSEGKLNGKVALVTGSSRGIGRAIAQRLSIDGASVVVNYAGNADKAHEVVSTIESQGEKLNLTDEQNNNWGHGARRWCIRD